MGIGNYQVQPAAVRGVLANVRAEREDLATLRTTLRNDVEDLMAAAKMRAVVTALSSVWNDVLAVQAEAAETRVDNAVNGMEAALRAYEAGDAAMMDAAHTTMGRSPALAVDDAITVGP